MNLFSRMRQWLQTSSVNEASAKPNASSPEEILQKIAVYKRSTWVPVVDEEEHRPLGSKIGGQAFIPDGEDHPLCPNCHRELTLFLQLNPKDLPVPNDLDLEAYQLIQLFYCTSQNPHCEAECRAFYPFAESVVARAVPLPATTSLHRQAVKVPRQLPEKTIVDWIVYDDYPDWHEMQAGDARLSEAEVETLENSEAGIPKAADKLGGWPYWVQGVEYPRCPECDIQMQMIFQLDSKHHLPYMFGDMGVAHLHQCRLHKNRLAFGWASY